MNRQIKFRVWDNQERRFKTSVDDRFRDCYLHLTLNGGVVAFNNYGDELDLESDRFTTQQSVNLKDKNGREVYEGDIVKLSLATNPDYQEKGLIEWSDYHNGWSITRLEVQPESIYKTYSFTPLFISYNLVEIIGNVFENPELL